MKKLKLLFSAIACLFLASCGKKADNASASANPADNANACKIGVLAPAVTHGWVAGTAFFAEEQCKKLASANGVSYKILTNANAEEMTQQLDELEAWGAQSIVVFPQWKGMEAPITAVIQRGTPVVSFDIAINSPGIYLISGDNEGMGRESAKYIIGKVGKDATVIALSVPSSGSVSELRLKGFMEVVKADAPSLNVIERGTKFTREDGLKDFADILVANKHIDAVFSMDDETSIGVLQAIREANRTDIKVITGGGGCQEYFKLIDSTKDIALISTLYSPSMICDAIDAAYALAQGKSVPAQQIIPTKVVDAQNCKEFLNADSPY